MTLDDFTFVLGAKDPEMDMIEDRIIVPLGLRAEYARVNGLRVHPGNAYQADHTVDGKLVLVECGGELLSGRKVDHHRPGDPGYGVGADDFFNASSLGQMIKLVLNEAGAKEDLFSEVARKIGAEILPTRTESSILFHTGYKEWAFPNVVFGDVALPSDFMYQAAADHCLAAGYAGKCPGVDKEGLRKLQAGNICKTTGVSVDEVLATILKTEELFNSEREKNLGDSLYRVFDFTDLTLGVGYSLNYLALKEAGTMMGKPYLVSHCFAEGAPRNLMLNSASEEEVDYFQNKLAVKLGLTKVFGSSSRGYAGGVLPK